MTLDEAVALAGRFHEGAVDKAGEPYIGHPLRVMARVSTRDEKMAAVLHDLLEDTALTVTDLMAAGCPARVVQAVDALTRRPDEPYDDFVRRAAEDPVARAVKLADIADNMDPVRLGRLDPAQAARLHDKYQQALSTLEETVPADPPSLHYAVGEPEAGESGAHASFSCSICGHPAGRVELIDTSLVVTSPLGRTTSRLSAAVAGRVAIAVAATDPQALFTVDTEFTPFWCPVCVASYCDRHWAREVVMDEGFYDCTYGTCPDGHRRMLDD